MLLPGIAVTRFRIIYPQVCRNDLLRIVTDVPRRFPPRATPSDKTSKRAHANSLQAGSIAERR